MTSRMDELLSALMLVQTSRQFENWARWGLRRLLPHAAFLGTAGKLYGIGSVPSHHATADFPLTMVEELKNRMGAIQDPMLANWLRTDRARFYALSDFGVVGEDEHWRKVFAEFGMDNILLHGVMDHRKRRFAVFQLGNVHDEMSGEALHMVTSLARPMFDAMWRTIDARSMAPARQLVGHPTLVLTSTEMHVVELLSQGLSNKEIARLRGVSDSTIKTQVARIGAKLGASRRAEIVANAMPMLSPLPAQGVVGYDD